jgi:hypothetical protein
MVSRLSRSSRSGTWVKHVSCSSTEADIACKEYLPETIYTVPAVLIGIILGPVSAKFLNAERWGSAAEGQQESITLVSSSPSRTSIRPRGDKERLTCRKGVCRVVIGVQLVIAGFQLPAKYQMRRWVEMAICLLPVMTLMWLFTTVCILVTVPNLSLVSGYRSPFHLDLHCPV